VGIDHQTWFIKVQHGGHGFDIATPGKTQQPGPDALVHMISDFFVNTLAP